MGRELKRVPMDFDWPIHQTWKGYICPYSSHPCKACKDHPGYSKEAQQIRHDFWSNNSALIGSRETYQHVIKTCEERGVSANCTACNGEGEFWHSEEIKNLAENFEGYDPPSGEGFQLWETTSEGSPISPVFPSLEELCQWLCETGASWFGSHTADYNQWMSMLSKGDTSMTIETESGKVTFI